MCKSSKNGLCWSNHCVSFGRSGAMAAVIEACKPGVKVVDLCETGDSFINSYVSSPLLYIYIYIYILYVCIFIDEINDDISTAVGCQKNLKEKILRKELLCQHASLLTI
jgi:hypothetical protein